MKDPVTLCHLTPQNILSFGPENPGIELKALNVLIGPNGCGKSNLIEVLNFMRASTRENREVLRNGGGAQEWIWKGNPKGSASVLCAMRSDPFIEEPDDDGVTLLHRIVFRVYAQQYSLLKESIKRLRSDEKDPQFEFEKRGDEGRIVMRNEGDIFRNAVVKILSLQDSVISQISDPANYPSFSKLSSIYNGLRIYRNWPFGTSSILREPQKADMRNDYLQEDFSNLGLYLNRIKIQSLQAKRNILAGMRDLYDGITDFDVLIQGGTVQLFLAENDFTIPASRLSDGTLHYLCLLAILCDPSPPPIICIEEPEMGLHPDILPKLAEQLKAASTRTQLIVTTHSDMLVDALTDMPEAVVICSKQDSQTKMERLDAEDLKGWLEKYRLGELWMKGEIGGTRWGTSNNQNK